MIAIKDLAADSAEGLVDQDNAEERSRAGLGFLPCSPGRRGTREVGELPLPASRFLERLALAPDLQGGCWLCHCVAEDVQLELLGKPGEMVRHSDDSMSQYQTSHLVVLHVGIPLTLVCPYRL